MTLRGGSDQKVLEASFPRTVSIYEGSDVRVLGVPVGDGHHRGAGRHHGQGDDGVRPRRSRCPTDVKAAIIAPSVVGDRYVQLTPVYEKGPVLEDGATLDTDRTAIPLELDEIYQSLDDIAVALGPDGANKDGALTRLLQTTAENFGGQGEQFNETIRNLSRFTSTLDNNKDALFDTAREVERFVNALEENDQTVRDFNDSLAAASVGPRGGARRPRRRAAQPRHRDRAGVVLRQGERAGAVREHRGAGPAHRHPRQAAGRARRDAERGTDGAVEPVPHLQPARPARWTPARTWARTSPTIEADPLGTLCSLVAPVEGATAICDQLEGRRSAARPPAPGRARRRRQGRAWSSRPIDTSLAGILEVQR